ncbi:cyclic nucleotide-binding domain-containing protein [Atopomonas sediminilitoris]|uniref:cyclic nucleotide-binding domain-containing protein n=1 Tax=Atopomonas sediminilitoris TaxID=2919919 RepID=UPI001F4DA479|nr:cyclic nucleotide-binding domain-containing protein [Atopomonas sediminilitoris]MCJ8170587.1 cyclic nucleotide-binding domain-containing protein [Atopomonas sediminilitoris]
MTVTDLTLPSIDQRCAYLRTYRWFAELPAAALEQLAGMARIRTLADGQCLHRKGDAADGLYGVLSGCIKVRDGLK